jgi:hypothetical protein
MRVQRAHNREGRFSDLFGPPKIWVGVGPRQAPQFRSSFLVWQAKKAAAAKKAAEEAERVRSSPHSQDGCGLRRPASDVCSCVEWRHPSHAHSALCRTHAVRLHVRVHNGGAMGATACAFAML